MVWRGDPGAEGENVRHKLVNAGGDPESDAEG